MLTKRVLNAWGINRPGSVMKATLDKALTASQGNEIQCGTASFFWLKTQKPEEYDKCRAKCSEELRRDIKDIPPEELANGIILILARQIAMQRDDLLRETAHLFGFTRLTPAVETAVSLGIRAAKQRGKVAFDEEGKVTYVE